MRYTLIVFVIIMGVQFLAAKLTGIDVNTFLLAALLMLLLMTIFEDDDKND